LAFKSGPDCVLTTRAAFSQVGVQEQPERHAARLLERPGQPDQRVSRWPQPARAAAACPPPAPNAARAARRPPGRLTLLPLPNPRPQPRLLHQHHRPCARQLGQPPESHHPVGHHPPPSQPASQPALLPSRPAPRAAPACRGTALARPPAQQSPCMPAPH
jgi:hypothetical protein